MAMVVATVPPSDTEPWLFRLKVIGGAGFFVVLGLLIYWERAEVEGILPSFRSSASLLFSPHPPLHNARRYSSR